MYSDFPFFILGCVRSGTTMVRKTLVLHPRLECPEETHFYRWADPFGTQRYDMVYEKNKIIIDQHEMDGFSQDEFLKIYNNAGSRKQLLDEYMRQYMIKQGNPDGRWFDKTPQHIYGALLIDHSYPDAKFIHLVRNPLNVAASLVKGVVMPKHDLAGAINYWNESVSLAQYYKGIFGDRFLEVRYEDFVDKTEMVMKNILEFIGEDVNEMDLSMLNIHSERNQYLDIFNSAQIDHVISECKEFMLKYNYLPENG